MTPEELAAYREWIRIMEFKDNTWPCMALIHIDQQAARIKELDDAVSGPLENIAKMLETVNADTIFSGIIQTWKNENSTLKTRITELEAQVAALKEIAVEGHAKEIYPFIMPMWKHLPEEDTWIDDKLFGKSKQVGKSTYRYHARNQLAEEHPEAFR